MRDFLKSLSASLLALLIFAAGSFVLMLIVLAAAGSNKPVVPSKAVLVLNLDTTLSDGVSEEGPSQALQKALQGEDGDTLPLSTLMAALDRAAKDPKISALYLTGNLDGANYGSGPAALKEAREAIQRFKAESGKPVIAYNMSWSRREYYLAAGASKVYVNPVGGVDMTAPMSELTFMANGFKKYGIQIQPTRVGKYKSYVEPFILDKMSNENREQIRAYMGDLWADWKGTVAADRKRTADEIQALADTMGAMTAQEAQKAGLVDRVAYHDEVLDELRQLAGRKATDRDFPQVTLEDYARTLEPGKGRNRIAVVYAEGGIVDGEGLGQVGGDRVARELRALRLDSSVKAVVLRVNSPGGSAMASDLIQREMALCNKVKPVVVSMGTVAASGGYWISVYSSRIFAEPNTITGSIGVVGMLPNAKALANEHGVTWDRVQMGKLAPFSISAPATPEELARVQARVDDIYDQFLTKVAEGRKLKKEAVHEIAQGRVWSGQAALKLGLVDEMGGLQDAIRCAAKLAKVENDYVADRPGSPKSPMERFLKAMGGGERRKQVRSDSPASQVKHELDKAMMALRLLNDPSGVYAVMPYSLQIR